MKNVLIVEDESLVALEISGFVKEMGYEVVKIVSNALSALEVVENSQVDVVLMDVNIKGDKDGIWCAHEIKKRQYIPIIYISAFSDDETLERAIETNPTSYLIKPFNRKELKVALQIATKRARRKEDIVEEQPKGDILLDSEFSFDSSNLELFCCNENIHLTHREKELLNLLISSKNSVLSFYEIENAIWPDKETNENTRRALIGRLRSKLNHKFLETVHSLGYRLKI